MTTKTTLYFLFSFLALAAIMTYSYASFSETLYVGNPYSPSTVHTGELDVGIWAWMGKNMTPYMSVSPPAKIWGYEGAVKTVEFRVENAYPGARAFCVVWVRNTGSIAAKVSEVKWELPDYVEVTYYGGSLPDWVVEEVESFVNELHERGVIDDATYNVMMDTLSKRASSGCLHEGLILDAGENDIMVFFWTFTDETPELTSFTGSCTIEFTQFNV